MRIIKKKLLKSTLAKVMAASMVVTMIPAPVNVSAEEENFIKDATIGTDTDINMQGDKTFIEALQKNYSNGVCILDNDYTITRYTYLMSGELTIDLNGHSISVDKANSFYSWGKDANLIIKNSQSAGSIKRSDSTDENSSPVYVSANGSLTLESGTIENPNGYGVTVARDGKFYVTGGTIDSKYSAIAGNNTDGDMNVYVSGNSTLKAEEGPAIYKPSGGDLFIGNNAANSEADSLVADDSGNSQPVLTGGVSVRMGDIKISGGTFTSFNGNDTVKNNCPATDYNEQDAAFPDAFFTMGGTYNPATIKGEKPEEATNDLNIEIAGGNFTCNNDKGSAVAIYDFGKVEQKMNVKIAGGTFNKNNINPIQLDDSSDITSEKRGAFNVLTLKDMTETDDTTPNTCTVNITGGNFTEPESSISSVKDFFGESGIKEAEGKNYCYGKNGNTISVGTHNPVAETLEGTVAHTKCDTCGRLYVDGNTEPVIGDDIKLYSLSLKKEKEQEHFTVSFSDSTTAASYGKYQPAPEKFTITPEHGYTIKGTPTVTSSNEGLVKYTVEDNKDGSYTCALSKIETTESQTFSDCTITVSATTEKTGYTLAYMLSNTNADVSFSEIGKPAANNRAVVYFDDTVTLKAVPREGYAFTTEPVVTVDGTAVKAVKDGNGYSFTIKDFNKNCSIVVKADASLIEYPVSLDRTGLAETDADVVFVKNDGAFDGKTSIFDKLQLVVTPKAGKVFAEVPVVTSDGNSVAGTAAAENGTYKYTISKVTGGTRIKVTGTAKDASHTILFADGYNKGLTNATVKPDFTSVADGGTVKLVITPDSGFQITSNINDIKVALKDSSACTVLETAAGANGTFVITLSEIKKNVEVTSVTATAEKLKVNIIEAGTDTSANVNEANLSSTFNLAEATEQEKSAIETNQKNILSQVQTVVAEATTGSVIFSGSAKNKTDKEKEELVRAFKEAVQTGTVALSIEVSKKDETDEEAKIAIKAISKGANETLGTVYPLDISLFAHVIGNSDVKKKLTEAGGNITIQMAVPSDIPEKSSDKVTRKFYILRYHNGQTTRLDCKEKNGKLNFTTDLFSTYVLYYTDTTSSSSDNNNNSNNNGYIPGPGSSASQTPAPSTTPSAVPSAVPSTTPSAVPSIAPSANPSTAPTQEPGTEPTKEPGTEPTKEPGTEPTQAPGTEPTAKPAASVKVGKKVTVSGSKYKVTATGTNRAVTFTGSKSVKNVTIPASIKISDKAYKVTAIANNAFKGNKKLAKVTIGANVKKIGKNAFKGCSNLKKIIIKTKKLTAKTVGKNAFKGINNKAVVKAPKNKVKSYNKIIKAKGAGKSVKVK